MPLKPNIIERLLFYQTNLGPGPMADLFGPLAFKAVVAAIKLDLFEALRFGPKTLSQVTEAIGAKDERGLRFLLNALEPLGYVKAEEAGYSNTAMTNKWLLRSAESSLADLFLYFEDMVTRFDYIAESVREGHAVMDGVKWYKLHPEKWPCYHAGMLAISRLLAPEILARVELPHDARRLLDLGGSHGLYAARFCERYPRLRATVYDFEPAREPALATAREHNVEGRVTFQSGDFLASSIDEGWDVVLLFNVVRAFNREQVGDLFKKVHHALRPGGHVLIMDQVVDDVTSAFLRANGRLIDLELFNGTPGDVYRAGEIEWWLEEAGFGHSKTIPLRRSNGQGVIQAIR